MAFVLWERSLKDNGDKSASLSPNSPFVSFSGNFGTATFSPIAVDLMGIKSESCIKVYVDKENNKIGFKLVVLKDEEVSDNIAKVYTQKPPQGTRLIFKTNIRPILEEFGIHKKQKKMKCELKKIDDMFVAELIFPKNENKEETDSASAE